MFRKNKKNSEKSEKRKEARAQAGQAADEKLQELKIKAEKSPRSLAVLRLMNRYSLLFHVLLACGVCFVIEWVSRHSFLEACSFVVDRNLVFLYNSLIVFASLLLVYTVRRRALLRTVISVFWLFLGIINGCILAKRVSPLFYRRGSDPRDCRCEPRASVSRGAVVQGTEISGKNAQGIRTCNDSGRCDDDPDSDGCGSQQQYPDRLF